MKPYHFILVTFMLLASIATAQQRPQYTQYVFNNYLLNPALSGIENYADVKMGYRKQWAGITNAPKTSFITANWNLGSDYLWRNALSLPEKGDDPMSKNYMQNYTASPAHHGMGVTAVLDKTGPISRLDANVTYAYHLQLANTLNLSVGAAVGLTNIALDVNALLLENASDPALSNTIVNQVKPDLGLGLWLYGARFFAGVAAQQIIPQKLSFTNDPSYNSGKEVAHYFITAGYKLFIDDEIAAIPSVMVKSVRPTPVSVDMNLKVSFRDRLWVGGSYRRNDSYSALVGFNMSKLINLTYSYDFTTSDLNKVSNGTHEIVLGLQLNNIYEVLSTTRMW
ncbi:type IX secretion system membrane protein PorP/SprF [Pedobacter sp. MC2016-14]|uniref:PorP/SprF family type IX secretion system membrane protein n=1 Tax=Pedobacter sp. MC2016-14 TaxID=2897327 RepID=UPI001E42A862|nr:type IX secretion system membrane protein PorP/SprF [Pedobacter sp. MC2016-14]MCD0489580.1 type IX secretion system membrane protein PorP/SprF [Pedobacter sp. MC2016-14]